MAKRYPVRAHVRAEATDAPRATEILLERRRLDQQVAVFRRLDRRLSGQLREAVAARRADYARELTTRQLSVRARIEEIIMRLGRLEIRLDAATA